MLLAKGQASVTVLITCTLCQRMSVHADLWLYLQHLLRTQKHGSARVAAVQLYSDKTYLDKNLITKQRSAHPVRMTLLNIPRGMRLVAG